MNTRLSRTALVGGVACLGLLSTALLAGSASASITIADVSNLSSPITGSIIGNAPWVTAQTFTAAHTGNLTSASAVLTSPPANSCSVVFSIKDTHITTDRDGTVAKPFQDLGTASAPVQFTGTNQTVTGALADIPVVAGNVYALLVTSVGANNSACAGNQLAWATTTTDYTGGQGYKSFNVDWVNYWSEPFGDTLFSVGVDPTDPVLGADLNVLGGNIGFANAPSAPTIAPVTLNGKDTSTTGTLPLAVSDARGTGAGWNVQLSATDFVSPAGKTIPASVVRFASPATAACLTNVTCQPATNSVVNGLLGNASTRLFSAASGTGMGDQSFTPAFTINLPAKTYKGNYSSTWVVSLVTGP